VDAVPYDPRNPRTLMKLLQKSGFDLAFVPGTTDTAGWRSRWAQGDRGFFWRSPGIQELAGG